jgi:hypothetical protein
MIDMRKYTLKVINSLFITSQVLIMHLILLRSKLIALISVMMIEAYVCSLKIILSKLITEK